MYRYWADGVLLKRPPIKNQFERYEWERNREIDVLELITKEYELLDNENIKVGNNGLQDKEVL